MEGIQMTTPVVSSMQMVPGVISLESARPITRAYLTKTPFVAVHFDEAGKGRITFLPKGGMLRVVGPSSCLPEGFQVTFEKRIYHVFEIDLMTRSTLIFETVNAKQRVIAACAKEDNHGNLLPMRCSNRSAQPRASDMPGV